MSKNENELSTEAPEPPGDDSVYDFLYHDVERVGSFLGQFVDSGHLKQIRETDSVRKSTKRGMKWGVGLSVPWAVGGNVSVERPSQESGSESSERSYDPLWANARNLMDLLYEADLIHNNIMEARIGQIVLIRGSLRIVDPAIFRNAWDMPNIKHLIERGLPESFTSVADITSVPTQNRHQRRSTAKPVQPSHKNIGDPSIVDIMLDIFRLTPHLAQAVLVGDDFISWCGLRQDALVTSSSHLFLEHGILISGEWNILGILDAHPEPGEEYSDSKDFGAFMPKAPALDGMNPVSQLMNLMAQPARGFLGRAAGMHGVTPILIFRELSD